MPSPYPYTLNLTNRDGSLTPVTVVAPGRTVNGSQNYWAVWHSTWVVKGVVTHRVTVREVYATQANTWAPGSNGIELPLEHAAAICTAIQAVITEAAPAAPRKRASAARATTQAQR